MCMGGGDRSTPDYGAQERAAKAEGDRIKAENDAAKATEDRRVMQEKMDQAGKEAEAKQKRTQLLRKALEGDTEEDPLNPTTRKSLLGGE